MDEGRSELINPGRRLPDLTLPGADGEAHPVRARGREATVLVLVHGEACPACAAFVRRMEAEREPIAEWDGRVLVVAPEAPGAAPAPAAFPRLADADGKLAGALGLAPPAVVVADQWGQVHAAEGAGQEHSFLPPGEVVSWLRYLAVQCPECQGEAF